MKPFAYVAAHSIPEAVALLSENSPNALPIAGGTYLLVRLKQNLATPKTLVDIAGIPELQGIALNEKGLRIGAMTTHTEIVASPLVRQYAPAVAASSASVGAIQTRNLGTIGGNLVACVPSNDSAPSLLVLDALVTVAGKDGQRQIAPRRTLCRPALFSSQAGRTPGGNPDSEGTPREALLFCQDWTAQGFDFSLSQCGGLRGSGWNERPRSPVSVWRWVR